MNLRSNSVLFVVLATWASSANPADPEMPTTVAPHAKLHMVYAANSFFEGPTWDPAGGKLYFTSFPSNAPTQILRLDGEGQAEVWADDSKGVNGTFLSMDGRLLAAQAFGHRVLSYSLKEQPSDDTRVLAENNTWNQPNDICQTPNENIYFTDPDFQQRKSSAVYLMTQRGEIKKIITDMPAPNGLIASRDGQTLYIADSHEKLWRSYPILQNGTVGEGRVFFDPDTENENAPDGVTIDERENLYLTGRGGVWVVTPSAQSLGLIALPEFCSNVTFGGPDRKTLYLTCQGKVYSLQMSVCGGR